MRIIKPTLIPDLLTWLFLGNRERLGEFSLELTLLEGQSAILVTFLPLLLIESWSLINIGLYRVDSELFKLVPYQYGTGAMVKVRDYYHYEYQITSDPMDQIFLKKQVTCPFGGFKTLRSERTCIEKSALKRFAVAFGISLSSRQSLNTR